MLTRLDSFTRKHVILMEPYTSSFIPRPPTWPGMRLTHLLGNLQVDAGYLKHCAFHRNYVQQGKTHTNCMTWRFRNKARHICMCPPLKNEMRMMFKRNCNLWYKAASREVPCFKCYQTHSACSIVPTLFHFQLAVWKEVRLRTFSLSKLGMQVNVDVT